MKKEHPLLRVIKRFAFAYFFISFVSVSLALPFFAYVKPEAKVTYLIYHSLLCVTLYCIAVYLFAWKEGFSDIGKVKRDVIKENKYRGFAAISIVFAIPMFCAFMFFITNGIWNFLNLFLNFPLFGIIGSKSENFGLALILLILAYAAIILTAGLGYLFGYKEISVYRKIAYKNEGNKKS